MVKIPDIIPVSDLRQDAAAVLKRVRGSSEPLVITQRGRAAAVLIDAETYRKREDERQILELLVRGNREIAAGKGHDLDAVLSDADQLLASDE